MIARRRLPIIMLAIVLTVIACSDDGTQVTLAELAEEQEQFRGDSVAVCGLLRKFDERDNDHYVLEDEVENRVGVTPRSEVATFVGRRVCVVGAFDVDPEFGRVIQVDSIKRVERRP